MISARQVAPKAGVRIVPPRSFWHVHDTNGEKMNNSKRLNTRICGSLALVILLLAISSISLSKASAIGQPTPVVTQVSKPLPTATSVPNQDLAVEALNAQIDANHINTWIAIFTFGAVVVAFIAIYVNWIQANKDRIFNQKEAEKDREANQKQAQEDRQHQSCPIIVPTKAIYNVLVSNGSHLYSSEADPRLKGNIQWALPITSLPIEVSNIGGGPAFNVHGVLHGSSTNYDYQFISWNNGPIGNGKDEKLLFRHPFSNEFRLNQANSVDETHTLYYPFSNEPTPNNAQARLTITYHDLFGNKLVSIFDYTVDHRWVRVFVSMPSSPKIALDLKELNEQELKKFTKGN
jgi:hypothetical protein